MKQHNILKKEHESEVIGSEKVDNVERSRMVELHNEEIVQGSWF